MQGVIEEIFGLFARIDEENAKYRSVEKWDKDFVRETSAQILELTSELDNFLTENQGEAKNDQESAEKFACWLAIIGVLNMILHGKQYLEGIKDDLKGTPAEQLLDNEIFQLESCFTFYYDYKNTLTERQIFEIYEKASSLVDEYLSTLSSVYDIDSEGIMKFVESHKLRDGDPIIFFRFCKRIYERFMLKI